MLTNPAPIDYYSVKTRNSQREIRMKDFFSRLLRWAHDERHERLIIIILPCLAVAVSALILAPQLTVYRANRAAAMQSVRERSAAESADTDASGDPVEVYLSAVSAGEDMFISVCTPDGTPVEGVRFQLALTTPEGDEILCSTYTDGSCYLVELTSGVYSVAMSPQPGYVTPRTIECTVSSLTHEAKSLDALATGLNLVDGKLYYQDMTGRRAAAIGVDISCFNRHVDWDALREQGVDFVILRVGGRGWGSGHIYIDKLFRDYFDAAKRAGLRVGVYFYSTAVNTREAVEEAEFVVSALRGAALDMPVYLDTEYSGSYPHGRADRLSTAARMDILSAFSAKIRQYGYSSGIYSGVYYIDHELDSSLLSGQSVWIANYTRNNALPAVNYHYDIWQYTESGHIRGISGAVDINVILR